MIKHTAGPRPRQAGTELLPDHLRWVCGACGKTSRSRYGLDEQSHSVADPGWDEACISNARLCEATGNRLGPHWRPVEPQE